MGTIKILGLILALAALATGLKAAWDWHAASKMHPKPNWKIEPVRPNIANMGWTAATLEAFEKAGRLNARAALWTAASVALASASAVLGSLG